MISHLSLVFVHKPKDCTRFKKADISQCRFR